MSTSQRAERAANPEFHLGRERFLELTGQLHETYFKLDGTLAHSLRMTAAMIDTCVEMGVEPEKGQKLFVDLNKFNDGMITSRGDLLSAHREATKIRMRTDQATADGCLPWPWGQEEEKLRVVA